MTRLVLTMLDGAKRAIETRGEVTLMEAIRDAGIDDLLAVCGGCLACATCHVYVDEDAAAALAPPGPAERRMLAGSNHRRPTSRLACQVELDDAPPLLAVRIAPHE